VRQSPNHWATTLPVLVCVLCVWQNLTSWHVQWAVFVLFLFSSSPKLWHRLL